MKRSYFFVGLLALVAAHVTAQNVQSAPPFAPAFPETSSVGNAAVASASGFDSLYLNPAGFVHGKSSFTLATASTGLFLPPSLENLSRVGGALSSPASGRSELAPIFDAGGFGGTAAAGIGYTGSGLGLGLLFDGRVWGATPATMEAHATIAFVGGMALRLSDHLSIGGDVRPMLRVHVPLASIDQLLAFADNPKSSPVPALYGIGVGLDLGALATYGPLTYGFALNDIGGTSFYFAQDSLGALTSSIASGNGLPTGNPVSDNYIIPMRATLGVAYHPDLGSLARVFDPRLEVDYSYQFAPGGSFSVPTPAQFLDGVHVGVEVGLLSVLDLRGGYGLGRLSGGVGLRLPGFEVDVGGFQQVAPSAQAGPAQGISAAATIRF